MKTPLLWSCLALLGVLLAWLLWLGREDPVTDRDSTPGRGKADPTTQTQDTRVETPTEKVNPSTKDSRQRMPAMPPRSMRIRVLFKADHRPAVGATVTARKSGATTAVIAKARTDASGTVVIPRREGRCFLEAAYADMWGKLHVNGRKKEAFEILLEKDHDLRVRVRSESTGAPVAGVLVGLRRFSLYGIPNDAAFERTASPDGIATFHHVQQHLNWKSRWQVFLGVYLRKQSFAPVSIAELPTEPVELVLPDTGAILIKIHDETRAPVDAKELHCNLSAYPTENRVKPIVGASHRSFENGMLRVEPIGLGLFLRIRVRSNRRGSRHKRVTVDFAGPERPGETVNCEVLWRSNKDPEAQYPVVVGRLVHHDKSPWPKAKIQAQPRIFPTPGSRPSPRDMEISAEGRFQLVVETPCPDGGERIYCFRTGAGSEFGALEARLDLSRKLPPGETDIGDVLLDRGELLVSGRVVHADGRPLPKARLYVTQLVITGGKDYWPRVECVGSHAVAEDGSFALHAIPGMELPTGRLRLEVTCPGLAPAEPIEFSLGTKGLRVVLEAGGALAGSIHLAPGQSAESIAVLIHVGKRSHSVTVKEDGTFHRDGLPPGPVSLVAFVFGASPGQGRVDIDDLLIRAGVTNRDPRIQDITLLDDRPGAQAKVEVFGEGGEPVPRALVRRLDGKGAGTTYADHRGHCTLLAKKFPVEVVVSGFGHGEKQVSLKAGRNKVVLGPALTITLLTKVKTIGKDPAYHLGFMIYHVDPELHVAFRHVYDHTFPYDRRYFDAQGRASVPVPGPGTYEVHPYVFIAGKDNLGRGGPVPTGSSPRIQVVAGKVSQRFAIDVSAGALADAVRRYSK